MPDSATTLRPFVRPYRREPHVVNQIHALASSVEDKSWRQAIDGGEISSEALVYLVRDRSLARDMAGAWRIIECLARRIVPAIRRDVNRKAGLTHSQRDDLCQDIISTCYIEWLDTGEASEFWEVRFGVCLRNKISTAIRRARIEQRRSYQPLRRGEPDDEIDPIESAAGDEVDPQTAAIVAVALQQLREPVRSAFFLFHHDDWTQPEIARHFNVTDRTVRNWLADASRSLRGWREVSVNDDE